MNVEFLILILAGTLIGRSVQTTTDLPSTAASTTDASMTTEVPTIAPTVMTMNTTEASSTDDTTTAMVTDPSTIISTLEPTTAATECIVSAAEQQFVVTFNITQIDGTGVTFDADYLNSSTSAFIALSSQICDVFEATFGNQTGCTVTEFSDSSTVNSSSISSVVVLVFTPDTVVSTGSISNETAVAFPNANITIESIDVEEVEVTTTSCQEPTATDPGTFSTTADPGSASTVESTATMPEASDATTTVVGSLATTPPPVAAPTGPATTPPPVAAPTAPGDTVTTQVLTTPQPPSAVDECAVGSDDCGAHTTCEDTEESFQCNCDAGYEHANMAETICQDINECTTVPCDENADCTNTNGSYVCTCIGGFYGDGQMCSDVDECQNPTLFTCPEDSTCDNNPGSYECDCDTGYTNMSEACVDIDECATMADNCHVNANCTNNDGSFTCLCNAGYAGNGVDCVDVNECSNGDASCTGPSHCVNTDGSFQCDCDEGYEDNGSGTCIDVNECSNAMSCPANSTCDNTAGSFTCTCDSGFTEDGDMCSDIDECGLSTDDCSQICTNTVGGYTCSCDAGFALAVDMVTCEASSNCSDPNYCGPNAVCFVNVTSDTCRCNNGFQAINDTHCQDIDECTAETDECDDVHGSCDNTEDGYTCSCDLGYELANDMRNCLDIDECLTMTDNCDSNAMCTNTDGGFNCTCNEGYEGNGTTCTNIDECQTISPCHSNATCTDSDGSYTCECMSGFIGDGLSCFDIDECSIPSACHADAECTNTQGSHVCTCNSGYTGDGLTCTDDNECNEPSSCADNSDCTNTAGSFYCVCDGGFRGDARVSCADIDECNENLDNCHANAECFNNNGSYTCECMGGYVGDGTTTCDDINECTTLSLEHIHECDTDATCSNEVGSYTCTCNSGYAGSGMDGQCQNVDECSDGTDMCDSDASCVDTIGSYTCTCNSGYAGDGRTCEDVDECYINTDNCSLSNHEKCINTVGGFTCGCQTNYFRVNGICQVAASRNLMVIFVQILGTSAIDNLGNVDTSANRIELADDVFDLLNSSSTVRPDLLGVAVTDISDVINGTQVTFLVDLDAATTLTEAQVSQAFVDGLTGDQNNTVPPNSLIKAESTPTVVIPDINPCEEGTDNCYTLNYAQCVFVSNNMFSCMTCLSGYEPPSTAGETCIEIFPCMNSTVAQSCKDQDFVDCVHDGPGQYHCENCLDGWTLVNGLCKKLTAFRGSSKITDIGGAPATYIEAYSNTASSEFMTIATGTCNFLKTATGAAQCTILSITNGSIIIEYVLTFLESENKTEAGVKSDIITADDATNQVQIDQNTITVVAILATYCEFVSCLNGGTCAITTSNQIDCTCASGYTGSDCGTAIIPTTPAPVTAIATLAPGGGLSTGAIIGIVVGASVALLVIIVIIVIVVCKSSGSAKVGTSQEEMALQERER